MEHRGSPHALPARIIRERRIVAVRARGPVVLPSQYRDLTRRQNPAAGIDHRPAGEKLATLKGRAAAGVVGREEILLATDALLQAQQTLEELRLPPKKGVRVELSSPYGADARLRRAGESPSIRP